METGTMQSMPVENKVQNQKLIKTAFSKAGWMCLILVGCQIVPIIIYSMILNVVAPDLLTNTWFGIFIPTVLSYIIAIPFVLLLFKKTPNIDQKPNLEPISPLYTSMWFVATLAISLILSVSMNLLSAMISEKLGLALTNPLEAVMNGSILPSLLLLLVIAPIIEEYIFRWVLYKKLAAYGGKTYVLISAMLFALFHMNLFQTFYTFVLGLFLAYLTYRTGKIAWSILCHFVFNFLGGGFALIANAIGGEDLIHMTTLIPSLLMMAGLVFAIYLYVARRKKIVFAPVEEKATGKLIFANAGMMVCVVILGLVSVLMIFGIL